MAAGPDDRGLSRRCAVALFRAFARYAREDSTITRRAPSRFVRRDWHGARRDVVERLDLYSDCVREVVESIVTTLSGQLREQRIWSSIKADYAETIREVANVELAETFFNSVTRRVFSTVGVDPAIEFVDAELDVTRGDAGLAVRRHVGRGDTEALTRQILQATSFADRFHDIDASARLIAYEIESRRRREWRDQPVERIEIVDAAFYRGFGVYLIGRIVGARFALPLAISFLCDDRGVVVDAVLMTEDDVSIVFSFTRSYFLVDVERVKNVVAFLQSILPRKHAAELYIALGYNKHGKSELYRHLLNHLRESSDCFEIAPGDAGMVMIVFTLPSYDVVFKVIRDRFTYPKTSTREDVMDRYRLVFRHDRAGRLVDAQEFEFLEFARERFSEELLAELTSAAGETVGIDGDRVIIRHLYIERRVRPLNLFLRQTDDATRREAILDYGRAIKDLAASDIFPGDLLLKNFGVTRHGRVIFYDYDELCLLTDCNFRDLPTPRNDDDELSAEAWFYVAPNDIFPEEFARFVGVEPELLSALRETHGEIFEGRYWREIQQARRVGVEPRIFGYPAEKRLRGRGASLPA